MRITIDEALKHAITKEWFTELKRLRVVKTLNGMYRLQRKYRLFPFITYWEDITQTHRSEIYIREYLNGLFKDIQKRFMSTMTLETIPALEFLYKEKGGKNEDNG